MKNKIGLFITSLSMLSKDIDLKNKDQRESDPILKQMLDDYESTNAQIKLRKSGTSPTVVENAGEG